MEASTTVETSEAALEEARAEFAPVSELARLKALAELPKPSPLPTSLPLSAINMLPELFQPRGKDGIDERHVQELKRSVKVQGALEPVLVAWFGPDAYLIDGHHRIAAYQQAEFAAEIPITSFEGTVREAVLEAGRANTRAKLPMDTRGRQDFAWRLVVMGGYSKTEIRLGASVSDGQVGVMRRTAKELGAAAIDCGTWWQAQQAAKGISREPLTDDEVEAFLEQQASEYADRMWKAFSKKLATNPELAARAFNIYFGRRLPELVRALGDYVDEVVDDPDAEF